jgi:enoyl-CoA hydratase
VSDYTDALKETTAYEEFRYEERNYDLMKRIWDFPLPTIGAVDGYALAGGFELSQMLDIVIASEDAEFGYPITRGTGTPPVFFLPFVVDNRTARELLFTGRHVSGEEAAEVRLANRVVPVSDLDEAVDDVVEQVLRVPSDLLYLNKRMMNRALDIMGYTAAVEQGHDLHVTGHTAPSVIEFGRRVEEDGLQAALEWRNERVKE